MKSVFLFALIFLAGPKSFCDEGFSYSPPEFLKNAWANSVYVELGPNPYGGRISSSGIILHEEKIGNKSYVYVLTVGHNADTLQWPVGKAVVPASGLIVPSLFKNVRISLEAVYLPGQTGVQAVKPNGSAEKDALPVDLKFVWGFLMQSPTGQTVDAGLLVYEEDRPLPNFVPTGFANPSDTKIGDPSFEIGFPGTAFRPESAQKVKIQDPELLTKRLSVGHFSGELTGNPLPHVAAFGSTTDTMLGNSGGAIFNQNGQIVGIASFLNSWADENWIYDSSASWIVAYFSTEALRDFVSSSINNFKKSLP